MPNSSVHQAAVQFAEAGISVVPAALDGTKRPVGAWKHWQAHRMTAAQVDQAFAAGHPALGIITGAVSGNLEMLELEGRAVTEGVLAELTELAAATGLTDVWRAITAGYLEQTPSGGIHILYRVSGAPVGPNTKLARRPATPAELEATPGDRVRVLIETRGEGGFVVVAPSHGPTHPTGQPWRLATGAPATIATITAAQRDQLHQLAATFDQLPPTDTPQPFTQPAAAAADGGLSPGDDFEARTPWEEILKPHGWSLVYTRGNVRYWRRPGKTTGISATTGQAADRDRLYVFSSSTGFDTEVPYTKLGAYAVLEHAGNHHQAATALASRGFGRPAAATLRPAPTAAAPPAPAPPPAAAAEAGPDRYGLDDDSLALRLADTHHTRIRYCPQRRRWLTWNGNRWLWDDAGHVRELARELARTLPQDDKPSRQYRTRALSAPGLRYALEIAETDRRLVAHLGDLDADPFTLNTPAGAVDLRTGRLHAPDSARLCARSTTVAPDPTMVPTRWLRFLADTFAGDPALTSYVQRLLGLSLTGRVIEQILPFCYGVTGQNGKSTLLDVIQYIAGSGPGGYAASIPISVLLTSRGEGHPTEIAQLAGVRLAITGEPEDGQRFAEARIKLLTGGDQLSARYMHGDFFTFAPTHTIWVAGNHKPEVRTGGPAFWRRLRLIPFLHRVPDDKKIEGLAEQLYETEGPGILAWLIQGAAAYFAQGIAEPDSVKTATAEYENSQDTVGRFVATMCATGPAGRQGMTVKGAALFGAYESWCRGEGDEAVSRKAFAMALAARFGVAAEHARDGVWYAGIRLADGLDERDGSRDGSPQHPSRGGSQLGWG